MAGEGIAQQVEESRGFTGKLLGREVQWEYSARWIVYAVFLLRIVMGWTLFQAGLTKITADGWTAAGYLQNAVHPDNPFQSMWSSFAGSGLIDFLNTWGVLLVGLGLILGAFVRWNAFWGAVTMIFYWLSAWQGGISEGIPLEHGWVVDDHIVYAFLLFGLGAIGAGRILGVDRWLEQTEFVQENPWLRLLLG